uniref:Minor spike protein H n=1 Tax=Spiroplasma virus 4 TaxID=2928746 RepID=H_SPV4|nr:RecName: Full=Minor spike protein H; AltName: Full=H protein; AltName: Full=Pilot protein [Spiroplasma phage 4]
MGPLLGMVGAGAAGSAIGEGLGMLRDKWNRDFQERMSNTQYQRARKDMEAAGINPLAQFGSGQASSPSGGVSGSSFGSNITSMLGSSANMLMQLSKLKEDAERANFGSKTVQTINDARNNMVRSVITLSKRVK